MQSGLIESDSTLGEAVGESPVGHEDSEAVT